MLLLGVGLASLVYFVGLVYYAQMRPLDGDEGYYTTAARLVWEGKTPYKDFSYPQGVLLPYLYSWIWAVHPRSLVAMRCLSAACGAIAVFLWGIWLLSARRVSTTVALATFAVILFHPYWVWWNVAFKTFAVGNLLTSIAMICLYTALQSQRCQMVPHRRTGPGGLCVRALPICTAGPVCVLVAAPHGMALIQARLTGNPGISWGCGLRRAAHDHQLCQRSAGLHL